jgi:hypothetical protein
MSHERATDVSPAEARVWSTLRQSGDLAALGQADQRHRVEVLTDRAPAVQRQCGVGTGPQAGNDAAGHRSPVAIRRRPCRAWELGV